jgi:hypothetical protein
MSRMFPFPSALHLLAGAFACLTVTGLVRSADAQQPAHQALVSLAEDLTYTSARLHPMYATSLGIPGHDGELEQPSEASRAADIERLRRWQTRLAEIRGRFDAATTLADRDDALLLEARLNAALNERLVYQFDRKDYAAGANDVVQALYTQFEYLPVPGPDGARPEDLHRAWADITSRLEMTPAFIVAGRQLVTTPCHLFGVTGSKELAGAPEFLRGALTDAARVQLGEHSTAFSRFVKARDAALAAIADLKAYIDAHVASWPENYAIGREAYDRMLKQEELLPFDAAAIERMGYDELEHGWAEEAWVRDVARGRGVALGAASGGGQAPEGAALIDYYRDRIAELRKFVTDTQVVTIPAWLGSIQVVPTPAFLQPVIPGASMDSPRLFSTNMNGYYYITPSKSIAEAAARLDMNEDFDRDRILSTAAHEVMPGHFLQLSIAKRHPNFIRKIQFSSSFAEGWAYYGEEMFVRLGLYGDRLDGRLFTARWERLRGVRAIVDVKLASGEWTYEQAVDFFAAQAAYTKDQAEAAVASIARGPGYVIAYTVGRLQIETLLGEYLRRTQGRGSLSDFHDRLLSYGTTPLTIVGAELLADLDKPASAVRAAANY